MIGLASAANLFAGNENDRAEVQQFIGLLTRLAIVANGSVVLVSHPSNTGIQTGSGVSGSTAWHNAVRSRFFLHGVKKQDTSEGAEPDNDLREIEFMKNNYGPRAERLTLRWQDGLFLPEKRKSALQQAAQDQRDDEVFVSVLSRFTQQNRVVSANPGRSFAPSLFADEKEAKFAHVNSAPPESRHGPPDRERPGADRDHRTTVPPTLKAGAEMSLPTRFQRPSNGLPTTASAGVSSNTPCKGGWWTP
jgi:RecA-family ATPase